VTYALTVPYKIRREMNWMFRVSTARLELWQKVAKRSGLFRDPRCMLMLRATIEERTMR